LLAPGFAKQPLCVKVRKKFLKKLSENDFTELTILKKIPMGQLPIRHLTFHWKLL